MKQKSKLIPLTKTEQEFFTEFYQAHKQFLFYIAAKYCPLEQEREDLTQESLARLLKNTQTLQQLNEAQCAKYIALTVKAVYLDMEHKKRRANAACRDPLDDIQEREKEDQLLNTHLVRKLKQELTAREWTALEGKYILGCSHEELGRLLDISADTMRSVVSRAKKRAKKLLREMEQEGEI